MNCYVTAFYDIGREKWPKFKRSFDSYLNAFKPFINLFDKNLCEGDEMIVFIDTRHINELDYILKNKNTNIKLIPLDEKILNELHAWKTMDIETRNMNNQNFKNLVINRLTFPECIYPKYTLITHCKIDFVTRVIDLNISDKEYFTWVDFGLLSDKSNIPMKLLDLNKLDLNKINFNLINPIYDIYKSINFNLAVAPEIVSGEVFFGRKEKIKEYQKLYHTILDQFQNSLNIADDDQHIAIQCYFENPELFKLHIHYGWFNFLKVFQKPYLKVISFALWGKNLKYEIGLIESIKMAKKYYNNWQCWVYVHKKSVNDDLITKLNNYDNVKVIIKEDEEIRRNRFMLWRVEPLDDPFVEYLSVRDTDTRIFPREVLAVNEWVKSGKSLHIMRDHPQHFPKILGGSWGVKTNKLPKLNWTHESEKFFQIRGETEDDQNFLEVYLYSLFKNDRIIHDEIKKYEGNECKKYHLPFEKNGKFVCCYIYEDGKPDLELSNTLLNWLKLNSPNRISQYDKTYEDTLFNISNKIKNIYVLHYTKLVERKKNLVTQLENMLFDKFFNIIWIDNFDREDITLEMIEKNYKYNPLILWRKMTIAEIANGFAHKHIIEQIKNNDDIAIILEDDNIFKDDFAYHLDEILSRLPDDWDIICLGGPTDINTCPAKCLDGATRLTFKNTEIKIIKPEIPAVCTISCVIMNKKGATKILDSSFITPLSAPIDDTILNIGYEKDLKIYWCQPFLSYEGSKTDLFSTSLDRGF